MGETPITLTLHGLTLAGIVFIGGMLLKQHKVWIRMKDRVNDLWSDRCHAKGERFVSLENGNK